MDEVEAEAIEAEVASAVEHIGVIAQVGGAAAMANDHLAQVDAFGFEDVELFPAHRALFGVRRDWRAGRLRGTRRRAQALLLVLGNMVLAGRALDQARLATRL